MWWPLAMSVLLICTCNMSGALSNPIFDASSYQISVNETFLEGGIARPEPGFLSVSCSHANDSTLMYTLMTEENIPFTIDLATGELMVTEDLDYETSTRYNFTAVCTVTNNLNLSDSSTIVVSLNPVNEHRPSIQQSRMILAIVNELTPLGPLPSTLPGIQFNVTDADLPGDPIHYTLRSSSEPELQRITYNESLRGLVLTETYEPNSDCTPDRMEFRVTVCDIYPPDAECPNIALLVIFNSINDNDPVFNQSQYSTRVSESVPVNSSLLSVSCTDQDVCVGDFAGMEIVDGNSNGTFSIDRNGNITNARVLDYEVAPRHTLMVRCFDSGFRESQREAFATVEIQLVDENDNTPECSLNSETGSLAVGSHEFTPVVRLSCVDADGGMNSLLTYTVERGQVPDGRFSIDQATGELQFSGELGSDEDLDLVVTVSDSGVPPRSVLVPVRINVVAIMTDLPPTTDLPPAMKDTAPMLIIIVVCVVGGLLLILCVLLLCCCCCCCCASRNRKKSKKVVFYDPNHIVSGHPEPFTPVSFEVQGEREVSLYLCDQISASSESGRQTPVSRDLDTGDHVTTNMTLMVEKEPLGLVEAVSQELGMATHQEEVQESSLDQDTIAINMDQDSTQPHAPDQDSTQPHAPDQDSIQPLDQDSTQLLDTDSTQPQLDQDTAIVIENTTVVVIDTSSL